MKLLNNDNLATNRFRDAAAAGMFVHLSNLQNGIKTIGGNDPDLRGRPVRSDGVVLAEHMRVGARNLNVQETLKSMKLIRWSR